MTNIFCTSTIIFFLIAGIVYIFSYLYDKNKNCEIPSTYTFDKKKYFILSIAAGFIAALVTFIFLMIKDKEVVNNNKNENVFSGKISQKMKCNSVCGVKNKMSFL
jgi:uncharacterized membrane protein YedE/YeeE